MDRALNILQGHVGAIMDVEYNPTGQEIVTASYDRTIRIFKRNKGRAKDIYHTKRMQRVFACKVTEDAKYILSGSDDGNIRIWRAKAAEREGVKSARQRQQLEYSGKLMERYQHMPEIRRIRRHRHVPNIIEKAEEIKRLELNGLKRRRENERKYFGRGNVDRRSERVGMILGNE